MPEAGFLSLTPAGASRWELQKMGLWNDGHNIARRGGGQLQAVEAVRATLDKGQLIATPLDCALVAPATAPFMPFQPDVPVYDQGLRFNLYNNKWGTNFPMWWEGTAAFRMVVAIHASRVPREIVQATCGGQLRQRPLWPQSVEGRNVTRQSASK